MEKDNFRNTQKKKNKKSRVLFIAAVYILAVVVIAGITVTALLLHKPSVDPTPQFPTDGNRRPTPRPSRRTRIPEKKGFIRFSLPAWTTSR